MKKLLSIALVVVLLAGMAVSGTMAYLQDTDSDVNVMTLGNVDIEQIEQEWNESETALQSFTQAKPLYPYVGTLGWENETENGGAYRRFTMENVVDKYVTVKNTGKSDAYVRTVFAFEMGSMTLADWDTYIGLSLNDVESKTFDFPDTWMWSDFGTAAQTIQVDGNTYAVYSATHIAPVKPGEETIPSLLQVYMTDIAGNEQVEALDGNKNGMYDILVLSQAVQTAGFDSAEAALNAGFGEANATNATEWFGGMEIPTPVANNAELDAAIKAGDGAVLLGSGNYIIPDSAQGKKLTIVGNGETVIATQDDGSYEGCDYSLDGSTVTFEGITINTDSSTYTGYARMNGTYNNCTINGTYTLYGDSVFNNCTFNVSGDVYNIWTWGASNVTFNNCTFNSDGKALLLYGTENTNLTVNKCVFNDNGGLTDLKAAIEIGNDYNKSYTLTVNDTIVNDYEINDKGIVTGTTLWANKDSMPQDKLNVVVNGVDVY